MVLPVVYRTCTTTTSPWAAGPSPCCPTMQRTSRPGWTTKGCLTWKKSLTPSVSELTIRIGWWTCGITIPIFIEICVQGYDLWLPMLMVTYLYVQRACLIVDQVKNIVQKVIPSGWPYTMVDVWTGLKLLFVRICPMAYHAEAGDQWCIWWTIYARWSWWFVVSLMNYSCQMTTHTFTKTQWFKLLFVRICPMAYHAEADDQWCIWWIIHARWLRILLRRPDRRQIYMASVVISCTSQIGCFQMLWELSMSKFTASSSLKSRPLKLSNWMQHINLMNTLIVLPKHFPTVNWCSKEVFNCFHYSVEFTWKQVVGRYWPHHHWQSP